MKIKIRASYKDCFDGMKYKNMATDICRKVMEKCYQKSAEVRFRTIDLNRYVLLLNIFGFLIT